MTNSLLTGNITAAVSCFSSVSADNYRQSLLGIGSADLTFAISQMSAISPSDLESMTAEYYFTSTIAGQTLTFPITFIRENGMWKIMEY